MSCFISKISLQVRSSKHFCRNWHHFSMEALALRTSVLSPKRNLNFRRKRSCFRGRSTVYLGKNALRYTFVMLYKWQARTCYTSGHETFIKAYMFSRRTSQEYDNQMKMNLYECIWAICLTSTSSYQ